MTDFSKFWRKKERGKFNWLWVVMLVALFAMVFLGQSTFTPPPSAAPTAVATPDTTPATTEFLPDYDSTVDPVAVAESDNRPFWQIALDMGVKLLLVIGLVYATLLGLRWLQKFKNPMNDSGAAIQVLETVGLAPGRSLHLIVVGEKTLLLGSTEQNISLLSELADAHIPLPEEESSAFEAQLSQTETSPFPIEDIPAEVSVPPWQTTLSQLHHNVQSMRQTVGGLKDDLA